MHQLAGGYFFRLLKIGGGLLLVFVVTGLMISQTALVAITSAYLLSFVFVASNLGVVQKLIQEDQKKFYKIFFISIAVRFVLVIGTIILLFAVTKIHQIYFTVSFIISYIFHSVTEIIFINKILETDS